MFSDPSSHGITNANNSTSTSHSPAFLPLLLFDFHFLIDFSHNPVLSSFFWSNLVLIFSLQTFIHPYFACCSPLSFRRALVSLFSSGPSSTELVKKTHRSASPPFLRESGKKIKRRKLRKRCCICWTLIPIIKVLPDTVRSGSGGCYCRPQTLCCLALPARFDHVTEYCMFHPVLLVHQTFLHGLSWLVPLLILFIPTLTFYSFLSVFPLPCTASYYCLLKLPLSIFCQVVQFPSRH